MTLKRAEINSVIAALKAAGCTIAGVEKLGEDRFRVLTTDAKGLTERSEDESLERELERFRRGHGYS